jgi:hypothetical protein
VRGADGVRDQLTELFASDMPRRIELLRVARGWGAETMPDVDVFLSGDVPDSELSSAKGHRVWLVVVNPRLIRIVATGDFSSAGDAEYHSTYSCRVFIRTKGEDWQLSEQARDHIAEAARATLLQYPSLSTTPGETGYRLVQATYNEDYGLPARVANNQGAWAAAILTVDVLAEECVDDGSTLPSVGEAQEVDVATLAVGATEPMNGET